MSRSSLCALVRMVSNQSQVQNAVGSLELRRDNPYRHRIIERAPSTLRNHVVAFGGRPTAPTIKRPGDMIGSAVRAVGVIVDRYHHCLESFPIVNSANDLVAHHLRLRIGPVRIGSEGNMIGDDIWPSGLEPLEQLLAFSIKASTCNGHRPVNSTSPPGDDPNG